MAAVGRAWEGAALEGSRYTETASWSREGSQSHSGGAIEVAIKLGSFVPEKQLIP